MVRFLFANFKPYHATNHTQNRWASLPIKLKKMKELIDLGFEKIGKWNLENGLFTYDLNDNYSNLNILYSFVIENDIKYIGKSIKTVSQRLNGYRKPNVSQRTNFRLNKLIIENLEIGKEVEIYLFVDNIGLNYRGHKINLSAGLEDNLIAHFLPKWNYLGKKIESKRTTRNIKIKEREETMYEYGKFKKETLIEVIIGKAYYFDGFFNIRKQFSDLFGENLSLIKIQLGENSENIIEGYVNRTANGINGYPRIMAGKEYTNWVQKNFEKGDILKVQMTEKNFITLKK